jgi:hypothetical protein
MLLLASIFLISRFRGDSSCGSGLNPLVIPMPTFSSLQSNIQSHLALLSDRDDDPHHSPK